MEQEAARAFCSIQFSFPLKSYWGDVGGGRSWGDVAPQMCLHHNGGMYSGEAIVFVTQE